MDQSAAQPGDVPKRGRIRSLWMVFFAVFGVSGLLNRATLSSVDEGFVLKTTAALVDRGSWVMDENLSGRRYSRFSPLPSLWNAPFFWIAGQISTGPQRTDWQLFAVGLGSCSLTALTAALLCGWLADLGYSFSTNVACGLLYGLGTLATPYSSTFFHQLLVAPLLLTACRAATGGRPLPLAIAFALAVACQLNLLLLAPAFLWYVVAEPRPVRMRLVWGAFCGGVVGTAVALGVNHLRGDPLFSGAYDGETFTTSTLVGLFGLLFSPGKGLAWFSPLGVFGLASLIGYAACRPRPGRLLLLICGTHLLATAHWWAWHGSLSWGPRLLLPILPLCLPPIAEWIETRRLRPAWQRRLFSLLAAISVAISIWAATQPQIHFLQKLPAAEVGEWVFIPTLSPFFVEGAAPAAWLWRAPADAAVWSWRVGLSLLGGYGLISCVRLLRFSRWSLRRALPWAALGLMVAANSLWLTSQPQLENMTDRGSTTWRGVLHPPLRGPYSFLIDPASATIVQLGDQELSPRRPTVRVDAAAIPIPIRITAARRAGTIWWILPGDGQYKQAIAADYLLPSQPTAWQRFRLAARHLLWLLYAPAFLLAVDWLLRPDTMEEKAVAEESKHDERAERTGDP